MKSHCTLRLQLELFQTLKAVQKQSILPLRKAIAQRQKAVHMEEGSDRRWDFRPREKAVLVEDGAYGFPKSTLCSLFELPTC